MTKLFPLPVQMESAGPSPAMLELIGAHKTALADLEASCNAADTMHPDYAGKPAEEAWSRASDREERALMDLLAFRTTHLPDHAARAEHLLTVDPDSVANRGGLEALLRSMLLCA